MSQTISACIGTFNEEENIAACIASLEGVDEVIVADDGSSDETVAIAERCGATVFRRRDWSEPAKQEYVDRFTERFGFAPTFQAGDRIRNGHLEARERFERASCDWIVTPDADERVTWDLPRLKAEVLPVADQVVSQFVHSHQEDGTPERMSTITKMWRRGMGQIEGRTHTVVLPQGRIVETDLMRVDHYQRPGHSQAYVLPILEYCIVEEDSPRDRFYLGREYYYHHRYDEALAMLDLYLAEATWQPEIGQARLYAARCYWESDRGDEARASCLQAVLINPDHKEALQLMSELYYEPWRSKWAYIASNAQDHDILFRPVLYC